MILILGGTAEAHALALELKTPFIVSISGATRRPKNREYPIRSGGFGGVDGLVEYLQHNEIKAIIDCTHPFAEQISHNAVKAARATKTPLLRLDRPAWPSRPNWQKAVSLGAAAAALPPKSRAFLTVGSQHLAAFCKRNDVWFLIRSIEPVIAFPNAKTHLQRPPFSLEEEMTLMRLNRITHLVTKNAGGSQTVAKLDAAEALEIPVIMVNRPQLPLAETVRNRQDALQWIRQNVEQKGIS